MKDLIYFVEDEAPIRELYLYTASSAGFEAECFENGSALFSRLAEKIPDVIILDVMLDGPDGYEILSRIKSDGRLADVPVIMVSAKDAEINKVKGLDSGADDYVSKPFGVLELVARIKAQLRKRRKKTEYSYADIVINDETHTVTVGEKTANCTLKGYNLLGLFVRNANKVLSRDEIFDNVWGGGYYGETRTLDVHVKELRKTLAENGSGAKIETVRGVGYVLK